MSEVPGFNFGAFIAGAIQDDLGVTAARDLMRASGGSMSNQAFGSMYGQVRDAIGGRDALQGLDYGAIPSGEQYSTWTAGAGDRYATFVTTYVRRSGERELEPRYFTHITDDPHAPQDAIDTAGAWLQDGVDENPSYGQQTVIGSVITSVNRTVGR